MSKVKIWEAYYAEFRLDPQDVRPACEPRVILHREPQENAIVLVHGLTDSPYFMTAIGEYLHVKLGFDVYIPLLNGHGLLQPRGMEGVTASAWIANVDWAIEQAHVRRPDVVLSIAGLSMGGVLSLHRARYHPQRRVTGFVAPFAAPVALASKIGDKGGDLKAALLRMGPFADIVDEIKDWRSLIGDNPVRYARMDVGAARQLVKLIDEVNQDMETAAPTQPIFAAHSDYDEAASPDAIRRFLGYCRPESRLFVIEKGEKVRHASIVLQEDLVVEKEIEGRQCTCVLEKKNTLFLKMMESLHEFARQNLTRVR